MSQIKTTLHGLNYDYQGIRPIVTTSHMLTDNAALAINIARDLVQSSASQDIDPQHLASTACEIVEALQAQFAQRRWRVKVPAVDADKLEKHYGIEQPKDAA